MEEVTLVKDFAVIMMVAGAVTLLFRRLRQPPVVGYLIAGLLVGPYCLPVHAIGDVHTISLLADLGLVLLLFGIGLEFSWSKIRQIGLAAAMIGVIEILTMICIGYGLGRALGWTTTESIFLGGALHISSSAIIVKMLRDMGRLDFLSSKLIVGILVVEDFAAVIIIAVLSGMATTGTASLGDVGSLLLRLVGFVCASLVLGALIVPRIVDFTRQFRSREALLITSLGLCFALALLSKHLGLSVAAGAFLMGAIIGDTRESEEITEVVAPVRDMFAAIFFVAIGMLIDVSQFREFIIPAVAACSIFIVGKILSNSLATLIAGFDGKTALQVGMGKAVMGEFSLAIAKLGVDRGAVASPLYPVVALTTGVTSLVGPYILRSADTVADFLARRSPAMLVAYFSRVPAWLQAVRSTFGSGGEVALRVRRSVKVVVVNILIIMVIIIIGTVALQSVDDLATRFGLRADLLGLGFGLVTLTLCLPSLVIIWRSLHGLVDNATTYMMTRRRSATKWGREPLRILLRDSVVLALSIFMLMWFIPFFIGLFSVGSFALAVPMLVLAIILYLVVNSLWKIHGQMERAFSRVLLGEEHTSTAEAASLLGTTPGRVAELVRRMRAARSGPRNGSGESTDAGKTRDTGAPEVTAGDKHVGSSGQPGQRNPSGCPGESRMADNGSAQDRTG